MQKLGTRHTKHNDSTARQQHETQKTALQGRKRAKQRSRTAKRNGKGKARPASQTTEATSRASTASNADARQKERRTSAAEHEKGCGGDGRRSRRYFRTFVLGCVWTPAIVLNTLHSVCPVPGARFHLFGTSARPLLLLAEVPAGKLIPLCHVALWLPDQSDREAFACS